MKRICVFCGSSPGGKSEYTRMAGELGRSLVRRKLGLVYGGATVGAMGAIARAVLAEGGDVIGVIPRGLADKEVAFTELPDLLVVDTMHERKSKMIELADGFIALPGGLGTLEEFFEALTWGQLGMHRKPCGLLNVGGYYDRLVEFLNEAVDQEFIKEEHRAMLLIDEDPEGLLDRFTEYEPPGVDKAAWILKLNANTRGQASAPPDE